MTHALRRFFLPVLALVLALAAPCARAAEPDPFDAELPAIDPAVTQSFSATDGWLQSQLDTEDKARKARILYALGWLWEHAPDVDAQSKSQDYYSQAKDAGSQDAELRLLAIAVQGWWGTKADSSTRDRLDALAKAGESLAYVILGDCYGKDACGNPANDKLGLAAYEAAADRGITWGTIIAGARIRDGKSSLPPATAEAYFRRAIEAGNTRGYSLIASMFREGVGVPVDFAKARDYAAQGAALGETDSMLTLGIMLAAGEGGPKDEAGAVPWLQRSMDAGEGDGCVQLGGLYEGGKLPGGADYAKAAEVYRLGIALTNNECRYALGVLYESRKLPEPRPGSAVHWLERAFSRGAVYAACTLGTMYSDGILVPEDGDQARGWYLKGAGKAPVCQLSLGIIEERGWTGHEPNLREAVRWYRIAADSGVKEASESLARLGAKR